MTTLAIAWTATALPPLPDGAREPVPSYWAVKVVFLVGLKVAEKFTLEFKEPVFTSVFESPYGLAWREAVPVVPPVPCALMVTACLYWTFVAESEIEVDGFFWATVGLSIARKSIWPLLSDVAAERRLC